MVLDATPVLRPYAAWRRRGLARQRPDDAQSKVLRELVGRAAGTRFGRDHGFADIRSVEDFQAAVPLGDYETFWDRYWQPDFPRLADGTWPGATRFFAVSSGTTRGTTKFLPLSAEMNRSNRRAAADILVHHLANRPRSRIVGGLSFMLGGSTALVERAPGIYSGDLSGIAARLAPWWARLYAFPSPVLEAITDWEEKVERIAGASIGRDIRLIAGVPSWLLLYFDRLFALAGASSRRLHEVFPNLEMLVHGGVNFAPYRERFDELLAGSRAETREVYPASEGFFAIADRGPGDGMRLILDNGLFYEFVPVDELGRAAPSRAWIADVETGRDYALAISSNAGLWSYMVGDLVRFVELDPPRVLMTGRTSYMLSAFGEHVIGEELERAVAGAASAVGAQVTDYAVGSLFATAGGARGGHLYIAEFAAPVADEAGIGRFAAEIDRALMECNEDYASHRADGFGLDAPRVHPMAAGGFAAWMKGRGKLGGQHKVPRVINDQPLFEDLCRFAGFRRGE